MLRTLAVLCTGAVVVGAAAAPASAKRIKTRWTETQALRGGTTLRIRVPWVDVTRTAWRARVGVDNLSGRRIRVTAGAVNGVLEVGTAPFTYYAGPGLLWSTYVKSTFGGSALIHSLAARSVEPRLPSSLAPHRSWTATIGGSSAKLPRGRLISVCLGIFAVAGEPTALGTQGAVVSTTHAFKLPER